MDSILEKYETSPDISYSFIKDLIKVYKNLKSEFQKGSVHLPFDDLKWRSDMQFLYELGAAYRYFKEHGHYPYINFKSLPNLSNARWNSRAILTLIAFFLMPQLQSELSTICNFISGTCDFPNKYLMNFLLII